VKEAEQNQEQRTDDSSNGGDDGNDSGTVDRRARSGGGSTAATSERGGALFEADEQDALRQRWTEIQTEFVDQPQRSVERANALVADLTERLVAGFRDEQARLEAQWDQGDEVSTEDLRVVLQRYRSFFSRLLELQDGGGS
jgi:hypothetical protein